MTTICQALGWPRSSYNYQPGEVDNQSLQRAIEDVLTTWVTYGYRRVSKRSQGEQ